VNQTLIGSATVVAPRAGAWIETRALPGGWNVIRVAPRAGAWIETRALPGGWNVIRVAPRAGAWIETGVHPVPKASWMSPPARGRGLKHVDTVAANVVGNVAPRAGAWIETTTTC